MIRNLSKKTFNQKIFDKKPAKNELFAIIIYFIGIDNAITKKFNISVTCYLYKNSQKQENSSPDMTLRHQYQFFQQPGNLYTCSYSKMIFYFINRVK
jgi:hypothetical protein